MAIKVDGYYLHIVEGVLIAQLKLHQTRVSLSLIDTSNLSHLMSWRTIWEMRGKGSKQHTFRNFKKSFLKIFIVIILKTGENYDHKYQVFCSENCEKEEKSNKNFNDFLVVHNFSFQYFSTLKDVSQFLAKKQHYLLFNHLIARKRWILEDETWNLRWRGEEMYQNKAFVTRVKGLTSIMVMIQSRKTHIFQDKN